MGADATRGGLGAVIAAGLLGGVLSSSIAAGSRLMAQDTPQLIRSAGLLIPVFDYRGHRAVQAAKLNGDGSGFYFYNAEDHNRLMAGIYPENPAEPLVSLSPDNASNAVKGLLRLAGGNHSGVVVVKDNADHDRVVMGLDLSGPDEEPFLVYFDKSGKKAVFGRF
jgi:hypothetical protein